MSLQAKQWLAESLKTTHWLPDTELVLLNDGFFWETKPPRPDVAIPVSAVHQTHQAMCSCESCYLFLNTVLSKGRMNIRQRNQLFPDLR